MIDVSQVRVLLKEIECQERIDRADPIAGLDVSLLQDLVLAPLLGIGDPRTDPRIDFVGGIRGIVGPQNNGLPILCCGRDMRRLLTRNYHPDRCRQNKTSSES